MQLPDWIGYVLVIGLLAPGVAWAIATVRLWALGVRDE
jgi:hypothetical protein